ncbi:MAG: hypothetical protein IPP40_13730 [bacterium]|nr:hypothetical protein [bacterium]
MKNTGNQNETAYTANYSVRQTNNTLITQSNITGGAIAQGATQTTDIPAIWTPSTDGVYRLVGTVTLAGDLFAGTTRSALSFTS